MEKKMIRNKRKFSQLHSYTRQYTPSSDCLFRQAEEYPSFFEDNLIDEDRTIKLFEQHPHPHQTIFYFQLLKLIFQTQDTDYAKYLTKIYDLIDSPQFQLILPDHSHPYYLSLTEDSLKRMIHEFLQELGEGTSTVYDMLNKYKVMDKIFVIFMRSLLIIGEKCEDYYDEVDPVDVYQFLCEYFEIQVSYYANCLRFNLSDLFVYFEAEDEIYLAYITPRDSEQHLPSSNQFYQCEDPEDAFNISSVHQMVSEIDIQVEEECFTLEKKSEGSSSQMQYEYSHSQEVGRRPSKSIQQTSDLKFSQLINDDSTIKSNKILQKESSSDKKSCLRQYVKTEGKQDLCYAITQAPAELQNAASPCATPKEIKFAGEFKLTDIEYNQQDHYYNRYDYQDKVKDLYFEQDFLETGSSEDFRFKQSEKDKDQKNCWEIFRKQTEEVLGNQEEEVYHQKNTQKNLKSLYDMRSIRTIVSCNDQSSMLQTPIKSSSFNPSFQPSFQPSFRQSHKQTVIRLIPPIPTSSKKNQYTKHGYVNNNISSEFTSSILLRQMSQPYKGKIETLKLRARKERSNIQKIMGF